MTSSLQANGDYFLQTSQVTRLKYLSGGVSGIVSVDESRVVFSAYTYESGMDDVRLYSVYLSPEGGFEAGDVEPFPLAQVRREVQRRHVHS